MDHSKVIDALKDLPPWRFFLLWIWLVIMSLTPVGWIIGMIFAYKAK